jgi:hypothetical protein
MNSDNILVKFFNYQHLKGKLLVVPFPMLEFHIHMIYCTHHVQTQITISTLVPLMLCGTLWHFVACTGQLSFYNVRDIILLL